MHRTTSVSRLSAVALAGLAAATGVLTAAGPASAASVTVRSPVKAVDASVDIRSTTIDYDRAKGSLAITVVLRGTAGRGRGEGPNYSVLIYGPRNATGGTGQAVIAVASVGRLLEKGYPVRPGGAATGPLIFNPVGTSESQIVPVSVRFVRNRVEFRAASDKLKNLPVQFFDVETSLDSRYVASDFATTDKVRGRLNG